MKRLIVPRSRRTTNGTVTPSIVVVVATSAGSGPGGSGRRLPPAVERHSQSTTVFALQSRLQPAVTPPGPSTLKPSPSWLSTSGSPSPAWAVLHTNGNWFGPGKIGTSIGGL